MRFEELAYRADGLAVSLPFHRKLTVIAGLDGPSRRQWAERVLGVLQGTAAGAATSLVFADGSGSRVRLVRDLRGAATITDLETGEDLAEYFTQDPRGVVDWMSLLGLDAASAAELMFIDADGLHRGDGEEEDGEDGGAEVGTELLDAREVLARVQAEHDDAVGRHRQLEEIHQRFAVTEEQIRNYDEEINRRRHGQAVRAVQRLEAELALLNGAEPAERIAAEAALAASRASEQWRAALETYEQAEKAFGDRRPLDPRALESALAVPGEMPSGLEALQQAYLAATERRADLTARLGAGAASELPEPTAPWVLSLARVDHPELWVRAEHVKATRNRAAELSMGLGGAGQHRALVQELEAAHHAVEEAERDVANARVSRFAMAAKRRLATAEEQERAALEKCGFVSWLAFQMRRIDVLLEPDAVEALRVAELETRLAVAAWHELAGDVDAEAALAARPEIERYAVELDAIERSAGATESLRRELVNEVEPAYNRARRALLEACRPFDVEPEHAVSEVAAIVSEARHARLQLALAEAEAALQSAETTLERLLGEAGMPGLGATDLAARAKAVSTLAAESAYHLETPATSRPVGEVEAELERARETFARLSRPEWDRHPLVTDEPLPDSRELLAERSRLIEEAARVERTLPDLGRLSDRLDALRLRVTVLEASSGVGAARLLTFEKAEMALLGRFAQARRVGPEAEPVPVIVDEALGEFTRHDKWRLLDLLARLGEASQVVYLTDDQDTADWAAARSGSATLLFPGALTTTAH